MTQPKQPKQPIRNPVLLALLASRTVEVGECFEWVGTVGATGYPVKRFMGHHMTVRRMAYCLHHALTPADIEGLTVWAKCNNRRCIGPNCMVLGLRGEMQRTLGSDGRMAPTPARIAILTKTRRARSKLPEGMDTAKAIRARRAAGESKDVLAQEYGISKKTVNDILAMRTWAETISGASVFGQLLRRAA